MTPLDAALSVYAVLATTIVIQLGALFYFFRKLKRLKEICEDVIATNTGLKDDIDHLRGRLKYLEAQNNPRPHVTFSYLTKESDYNSPLSRVGSCGSSIAFEDAQEELSDGTALINSRGPFEIVDEQEKEDSTLVEPERTVVEQESKEHNPFSFIDTILETDPQQCYDRLKLMLSADPNNVEVLWRFACACHGVGQKFEQRSHKRHSLIKEGHEQALVAYNIDGDNFNVIKWTAGLTGALTDFLGVKERIQQGYNFKEYLDKGLAIDPQEFSLLYMRGRFSFSVAHLSWIERKAAAAFYATPPTATVDEALIDFLEVEKIKPEWIENLLYIARCYQGKGEKDNARHYLSKISHIEPIANIEQEAQDEAKKLMKHL